MGVASILVLATLAQASTAGTNAQDRAKAQALLGEGVTLYERGNYFGALEKFNSAYAAYPSSKPRTPPARTGPTRRIGWESCTIRSD